MTVQLGSANARSFEVVDYAWTTVVFAASMDAITYKGSSIVTAGNSTRTNWNSNFGTAVVAGQLAWKNYSNNHTIFDASASTSPDGTAVNNTNAQAAWTGTYPTLMGWNGANTYGVRVDSSRVSDNSSAVNGYSVSTSGTANTIPTRNASGYLAPANWIQFDGAYGLYWPTQYGAHFGPNDLSTYTQFTLRGVKNSYSGFYDQSSGLNPVMFDTGGNGGAYRESIGRWYWYHNVSNNCTGFSTSSTASGYSIYTASSIYSSGNVVAASDERKKENIEPIKDALSIVKNLVGVYYNMIADEKKKRRVGFIAQKTEPHLPEVVYYQEENDQYGVSYGDVTAVLAEAIKQLDDKLEAVMAKLG
jgi:hypothetical protein